MATKEIGAIQGHYNQCLIQRDNALKTWNLRKRDRSNALVVLKARIAYTDTLASVRQAKAQLNTRRAELGLRPIK